MSPKDLTDLIDKFAQQQDAKLVMLLIGMFFLSLPGLLSLVRLVVQNRGDAGRRRDDITKLEAESRKQLDDTTRRLEMLEAEREAKRESAQWGVLSQVTEQANVLMTMQQQTLAVLEQTSKHNDTMANVIKQQTSGIAERNAVQAANTSAIEANTSAVAGLPPAIVEALRPTIADGNAQLRDALREDGNARVLGIESKLGGPIALIEGIPQRLDKTDEKINQLGRQVDDIPDAIMHRIAETLKGMSARLVEISDQITVLLDRHDAEKKEATNGNETHNHAVESAPAQS